MALADALPEGSNVALDTTTIIYFIEEHPTFGPVIEPVFRMISAGRIRAFASVISLIEVLTAPLREGQRELAQRYREVLTRGRNFTLIPVHADVAERAASLRAAHNLRTPDAIVAATAIEAVCSHLVTNDDQFKRVQELQVLVVSEFAPS